MTSSGSNSTATRIWRLRLQDRISFLAILTTCLLCDSSFFFSKLHVLAFLIPASRIRRNSFQNHNMVMSPPEKITSSSSSSLRSLPGEIKPSKSSGNFKQGQRTTTKSGGGSKDQEITNNNNNNTAKTNKRRRNRKKYRRKKEKPVTEKAYEKLRQVRQQEYEQLRQNYEKGKTPPSIWSFESLFPAPFCDEEAVEEDLYGVKKRDASIASKGSSSSSNENTKRGPSMKRVYREPKLSSALPYMEPLLSNGQLKNGGANSTELLSGRSGGSSSSISRRSPSTDKDEAINPLETVSSSTRNESSKVIVDRMLSRKVEESVYGYRRTPAGDYYDTSLNREGAVKFRDGRRVGAALNVNIDRLVYFAKRELRHGRIEEAQEFYEMALEMNPRDGRAYLGLSKIAERRRDFQRAKECLRAGLTQSFCKPDEMAAQYDKGANPFLLQALGALEEKMGHLSEAEALYIEAVRSRPSHAAGWVSLAQLRTRKFRQGAAAGRACYQTAERELKRAGKKPSSYVYTAWAALEYKKAGNAKKARDLFNSALKVDPKCSAALLQLGLLEADQENWSTAEKCFEKVLSFDQRNSRVMQAYAIMETRRPEGDSRKAIGLFERALLINPRDAGVLQPYALYCADLGDIDMARDLLERGTEVNKRHAPVWQAWGVLETRYGEPEVARDIFQQGIWACASLSGGKSGGHKCARLWQAWGVLEAREGDYAAARRCFNRALDADNRNVATITAWTRMEEDIGNFEDARHIFERCLKQFPASSNEKIALWRSYEIMEQHAGNISAAQEIYRRSMGESFAVRDDTDLVADSVGLKLEEETKQEKLLPPMTEVLKKSKEMEVSRWDASSMRGEVWLNDGSIEGKVPPSVIEKNNNKKKRSNSPSSVSPSDEGSLP